MKVDVLLGLQWGDEGKGKVVDYLASHYDVVARFQGGPNAGHTLEFDNVKHVLHQIPSGIFHPEILNVVGNGVVLDPIVLKKEIESLGAYSLDIVNNLYISKKAQLILPTHRLLDAALEKAKGDEKIGSTLKGIGPTYQDKIGRHGLRVGDIASPHFEKRYQNLIKIHKQLLDYYNYPIDLEKNEEEFFDAVNFIKNFKLVDSEYIINEARNEGKSVLAEGAQGALLDIDFGSYPYVTSSTTTAAGACTGLGVAPRHIGDVYGIFKAYCTRVGSGPFPTELNNQEGENIRDAGHEYGATTGRPRRCGWLDLPALKYAVMINGATQLFMMKADVLSQFDEIKICTHYKLPDGSTTDRLPYEVIDDALEPVYKTFPGWKKDISGMKHFNELPDELNNYIKFIEDELHTPINIVSVGPDRTETLIRNFLQA